MVNFKLKGSHTVTPAQPTPSGKLWLSESDQVKPLTHAPTIYFYRPTSGDVAVASAIDTLRDALSKVLVQFYPLAGRLHWIGGGRLELDCNAAGAKLFEAESEAVIDDFGDFRPTPEIRELIPRVDYTTPINELPLLLVQLTRFCCGGISVGVAISHIIVDGRTALQFVNTWAKVARGEKPETTLFLDRTVLHANEPRADDPRFDHVEFRPPPVLTGRSDASEERKKETTVAMLKLTTDQVEKLKTNSNEGRTGEFGRAFSRYEAVAGHMWRCACKSRAHEHEQQTKLRVVVDCRNRLRPPLPHGYFGNATFPTTPMSFAGELLGKPLGHASGKIREAVEKMTDEYVRSTIDFLKSQEDLTPFRTSFHTVGCTQGVFFGNPNLAVTSWVGLPIYDADFGWGKPIHMGPGSLGFDGKSFILPSREGDGSFIVALRLQVAHMDDFKKFFYKDI